MGRLDLSCLLCGAPIDDDEGFFPGWMRNFQALYTVRESWNEARLSGVGQRRHHFGDLIPFDSTVGAVEVEDCKVDEVWFDIYLMKTRFGEKYPPSHPLRPQPLWGFPMHCSCLQLLRELNPHIEDRDAVQALFHIFRSLPWTLYGLDWGHAYGGVHQTYRDVSDLLPGEEAALADRRTPLMAEYTHDPSGSVTLLDVCLEVKTSQKQDINLVGDATSSDPFRMLPMELILQIMIKLPTDDGCSLRLASRTCAGCTLEESYWRSRFSRGHEFFHLLPLVEGMTAPGKWRSAYIQAQIRRNDPAMINRKRIWELACGIDDLVRQSLSFGTSGLIDKGANDPEYPVQSSDARSWQHVGGAICHLNKPYRYGARVLFEDMLELRSPIMKLSATSSFMNGRTYIAGLTITQACGSTEHLGYHPNLADDTSECIPTEVELFSPIVAFEVAVEARGIRGLRAIHSTGSHSQWIGDHLGIPKKRIGLSCDGFIHRIRGGLDAIRLVSLSIEVSVAATVDSSERAPQSAETRLWYPDIPPRNTRSVGNHDRPPGSMVHWLPFSHVLFGGPTGDFLSQLNEVAVLVVNLSDNLGNIEWTEIHGLQFTYSGLQRAQDPLLLGVAPSPITPGYQRHSFSLDSPGGERIVAITQAFVENVELLSFTFHTSKGRSVELPPSGTQHIDPKRVVTVPLSSEGDVVIGMFAKLHKVVLCNLGLICLNLPSE